jgi:cathepsin B
MSEIVRTPETYPLLTHLKNDSKKYFKAYESLFPIQDPAKRSSVESQSFAIKDLPTSFEGRIVWKNYLSNITNQKHCGGCYAYASTSALADQYNIQTLNFNGTQRLNLSAARIILCNAVETEEILTVQLNEEILQQIVQEYGCQGNTLAEAWSFLYRNGTNTIECFPNDTNQTCKSISGPNFDECINGSPARFYRPFGIYAVAGTEKEGGNATEIQKQIYKFGPVSTSMAIYEDFYTFDPKKDMYEWDGISPRISGHAVVLDGWGIDPKTGVEFWWVRSSWGKSWGDNGYFRILRGVNHCEIEENVIVGVPELGFSVERMPFLKYVNENNKRLLHQKIFEELIYVPNGGIDKTTGFTRRILSYEQNENLPSFPNFADKNWDTWYAAEINNSNGGHKSKWLTYTLYTFAAVFVVWILYKLMTHSKDK